MPTRRLHRFFIHSALLALVAVVLASCTTAPEVSRDKTTGALVPRRVDSFVGNPSAKPYARRTVDDLLAQQGQSLNRYVTAETNIFEFKDVRLVQRLQQKWAAAKTDGFTIAHFGDSLVQGGYAAEIARSRLQSVGGSAGRGMVFPYSIAKTYSQNDYKSTFTGDWTTANSIQQTPRLPLGVSGFVARTSAAEASFTLNFVALPEPGKKLVKFFYVATSTAFTLRVQSGNFVHNVAVPSGGAQPRTQMLTLSFPELSDTLQFELRNANPNSGGYVEVHGVSIENTTPGVMYHNLGVGGATYSALLNQTYFEEQSAQLAPDLIVLDWGTNDLVFKNSVAPDLEKIMVQTIKRVKAKHPQALILITSAQDMNFRRKNITAAWDFAQLARRVAFENDCLFYDWYRVAGGRGAMTIWTAYGLASTDNIHLTGLGYAVKGDLFAQSLLNTLERIKREPAIKSLEIKTTVNIQPHSLVGWLKELSPKPNKSIFYR
ncbi:MAG: GDSL-type esterase/lipase family protein [Betaproteobacteria bacterium]